MELKYYPLSVIGTNCYFVNNGQELLIIDPSGESEVIFEEVENQGVPVKAILLTHTHWDHIGALNDVVEKYDVEVYLGKDEVEWLKDSSLNMSDRASENFDVEVMSYDIQPKTLNAGIHEIGTFRFQVLETPGHSPGSLSFLFEDFIVSGDVLFNGGVGRTDLHQSSHDTIMNTIHEILFKLDDDLVVYPGHGDPTTIGHEKRTNPHV